MDNQTGARITGGNSQYGRNQSDLYPTPKEATFAILDFLSLPLNTVIWEPACGNLDMVNAMRARGYQNIIATDVQTGTDYLTAERRESDYIITNPPFSLAEEFVRRSWAHKIPFALLLKAHFWNAKKRYQLFCDCKPSYVLPLTWRPDFMFKTRGSGSPLMDVSWCVWDNFGEHETIYKPLLKPENAEGGRT